MMRRSCGCFLLAVLFVLPFLALGYGYPDALGLGSQMPGIGVVEHGFAGASAVNVGGMNLFGNPAELPRYNPTLSATVGALILKQSVDDGLGKHDLTYAGPGPIGIQSGFNTGNTGFAVGIAKIRDYTYTGEYFFIDTNPTPVLAGFEDLTVKGGIWEAALASGVILPAGVGLGASAGYRMGKIDYEYYWHHFDTSIPDSISEWSREEGEFSYRVGASVPVGKDATAGAVYSSASENAPSNISAGFRVGNLASHFPGFGMEARVYDTENGRSWVANLYGGLQPGRNVFFRAGAALGSKGKENSHVSLGLSFGVAVDLGRTDINAAFSYANESRDSDVFGFPEARIIEDVVTAFSAGVAVEL